MPSRSTDVTPDLVQFARRRLYVGREHDPEIEAWLRRRTPTEHGVAGITGDPNGVLEFSRPDGTLLGRS